MNHNFSPPPPPIPVICHRMSPMIVLLMLALSGPGQPVCFAADPVPAAVAPPRSSAEPPSAEDLAAYAAIGSAIAQKMRIAELNWNEARFNAFVSGLRAGAAGHGYPFNDAARHLFDEINRRIAEPPARQDRAPSDQLEQYMRSARESLMMQQSESGLLCHIVHNGAGPRPGPDDTIVLSFSAKASDGTTELPQLTREKLRTKVTDLIPGLAEGVQMLALGGRAVLIVPPKLSFGSGAWPAGVDRGTPILFLVDLEDIIADGAAP